jgi:rod shape-determining protein MreC
MGDFLRRIRLPLLFAGLLLATVVLMMGDRRALRERGMDPSWLSAALLELAAPVQRVVRAPWAFATSRWSRYVALVDVEQENEELRRQLAWLEEEILQLREALVASGHLQRIAEMRQDFEVPLLPTHVVGQDVSPFFHSALLDRGRSQAVRAGMPVVTDRGLVGLVTATSPHAARTMMLMDRRSAVDGIVQRSRARGIVRGTGSDVLEFTFMVRGDDVQPGDVVITSGVGGVYPKGLQIGTVTSVEMDPRKLVHTAKIRPAVDFGRLEQVFVMLHRAPTMELLYEGDGGSPVEGLGP